VRKPDIQGRRREFFSVKDDRVEHHEPTRVPSRADGRFRAKRQSQKRYCAAEGKPSTFPRGLRSKNVYAIAVPPLHPRHRRARHATSVKATDANPAQLVVQPSTQQGCPPTTAPCHLRTVAAAISGSTAVIAYLTSHDLWSPLPPHPLRPPGKRPVGVALLTTTKSVTPCACLD